MILNSYTNQNFHDFDDFAQTLKSWDIQIDQLQSGRSINYLKQFNTKSLLVTEAYFNGCTRQVGAPPPSGCAIALLSDTESNLTWQNKRVEANEIVLMPGNSEVDAATKVKTGLYTISLSEDILDEFRKPNRLEKLFKNSQLVSIPIIMANELRLLIQKYLFFLDKNPDLIINQAFTEEVDTEVSNKIVQSFTKVSDIVDTRKLQNKKKVWERIENFFEEFSGLPVRIGDLCKTAQVSDRTLLRLFNDRFGVTPKAYINRIRLNGLRRELKQTDISKSKIISIANNWGFWHMGQMAADYKSMFGELPSDTFKQSKF